MAKCSVSTILLPITNLRILRIKAIEGALEAMDGVSGEGMRPPSHTLTADHYSIIHHRHASPPLHHSSILSLTGNINRT